MNRIEFMNRLTRLLSDLPEGERNEAIQYYNDYLNDAGVENEEEVLSALGTPEELALSIREGLSEEGRLRGEFSEQGYREQAQEHREREMIPRDSVEQKDENRGKREGGTDQRTQQEQTRQAWTQQGAKRQDGYQNRDAYRTGYRYRTGSAQSAYRRETGPVEGDLDRRYRGRRWKKSGMSGGAVALIVICALFAAPILLPVALALMIVFFALAVTLVVVTAALLFSGVVCIGAGILSFFVSMGEIFAAPAGVALAAGMSLLSVGVGILLVMGMAWVLAKVFPKLFWGCVHLWNRMFHRKQEG